MREQGQGSRQVTLVTWGVTLVTSFFWGVTKDSAGFFFLDQLRERWLAGQAAGGQGPQCLGTKVGARGHNNEERMENEGWGGGRGGERGDFFCPQIQLVQ